MRSSEIAELAAALTAGGITQDAIADSFGESVLAEVLGFAGGTIIAGSVPGIMRATGISDLLDEIF
jgi:hypothetical protein